MTALTEAREHVASVLAGLGVPVHIYPPGATTTPHVALLPGDPYWSGITLTAGTVGLEVAVSVSDAAGPDAAATLDGLIAATIAALITGGVPVDSVPSPTADYGQLSTRIPVTIHWKA